MFGWEKKEVDFPVEGQVLQIPIGEIRQSPDQTRQVFAYDKLLQLSVSIAENGMLQPITVCFEDGQPQLVAGERRLRAAKLAGMKTVPCLRVERDGADRAVLTLAENLQREALNPFEEAEAIARLIRVYGLSQESISYRLGYAQPTIANKLRLLKLPPEQRARAVEAGLTERHVRALVRVEDAAARERLLERVIREKLTVAGTERIVEAVLIGHRRAMPPPILRDVRVFSNTVERAIRDMRLAGIRACAEKSETEEYIEYRVRIPKRPPQAFPEDTEE